MPHKVGVQIELSSKNYVNDFKEDIGEDGKGRQRRYSYIGDIIVNETEVMVEEVVVHLRKFGLIAKLPESMDGSAALGLRQKQDEMGKLPRTEKGVVWCDASITATGVLLEIGGVAAEDAVLLWKKDDASHINIAELDAVLKGVNLSLKWELGNVHLRTDSATVVSWVKSVVNNERRVKTKGAAEMLVKQILGMLGNLIQEFGLKLQLNFMPSDKNKADVLTRVRKTWPRVPEHLAEGVAAANYFENPDSREQLDMHHMGVDKMLQGRWFKISMEKIRLIVRTCDRCQSINPVLSVHEAGEIQVNKNWERLAIDVTHYRNKVYLSMVDCAPGRFAIWKRIREETVEVISTVLEEVFLERGPVTEVLMDNGRAFQSAILKEMLNKWGGRCFFRAVYRPSGNGIVERHHLTIKVLAERSMISSQEAVFWYNLSLKTGQKVDSVLQNTIFKYEWWHPCDMPPTTEQGEATVWIGVWVKLSNGRCTIQWGRSVVTEVNSINNVSIDGFPCHI